MKMRLITRLKDLFANLDRIPNGTAKNPRAKHAIGIENFLYNSISVL
jgi:hypothetical protein